MAYPQSGPPPAGPTPAKKVGIGGCLISVALLVLSGIAFFGLIAWATIGIVNDLQAEPGIAVGETGTVQIDATGQQFIFLGNFDGGSIPTTDPEVTVTDPAGNEVPVQAPTSSSSGTSGSGSFRTIGEFQATTTGEYTVSSTSSGSADPGARIYPTAIDVGDLGTKLLIAIIVGGLLFLAAVVVFIIWLVRRSKAKNAGPAYR
jgi:heme/copper-type cytochrome/quinol oxidase subunit 2